MKYWPNGINIYTRLVPCCLISSIPWQNFGWKKSWISTIIRKCRVKKRVLIFSHSNVKRNSPLAKKNRYFRVSWVTWSISKLKNLKHRLTTLNLPMIGKLVTNPRYEPHDLILDRWSLHSFLIDQLWNLELWHHLQMV